jgi:beta-lactamase class A
MKSKILFWAVVSLATLFLFSSLTITLVEYNQFKTSPLIFSTGSTIAGVPVDGLDQDTAIKRLNDYFNSPVLLEINHSVVQVSRDDLGFSINTAQLVEQGLDNLPEGNFWDYLWKGQSAEPINIPLETNVNEEQIVNYLNQEIVPRYLGSGSPLQPIPNTTNFTTRVTGQILDIDQAVTDIKNALISPTMDSVILQTKASNLEDPGIEMLKAFLAHQIHWAGFNELVEVYLSSMETGETLHFAYQDSEFVEPDVAFTAASTIKIPIMISVLRRTEEPTPQAAAELLERMIAYSENPPADSLMSTYLDDLRGPLIVSEDLAALGMENTFLAGYFYLGAPVLQVYTTPANTRSDIFLDPDIYNQTVLSEIGQLLTAIYTCAADGSGLLTQTFPGEITQTECQLMIEILSKNKIGLLIEGGLSPNSTAAHKHGWVQELDGLLHSMSDVAIVFTPEGNYVLCIFVYDPERLDFDQGNILVTRLSQTVYNFFNPENQQYWWFE